MGAGPGLQPHERPGRPDRGRGGHLGRAHLPADDRRAEGTDAGNHAYSLVSTFGKNTIVLSGTADDKAFRTVATAVARELTE